MSAVPVLGAVDPEANRSGVDHLTLEWTDLRFSIPPKKFMSDARPKVILDAVSGKVSSGQMLAIMGPSGAGKSTLLDLLAKRTRADRVDGGKIIVNGEEHFDMSALGAYVEQSDALLGVLTVTETIRFAARLSLDPSTPKSEIEERVATVITELGLTDCAHNRIGNPIQRGISGGQKRRVTIGSALVTMPRILLLDEPTSGLDSRTSREVLLAIKNIAQKHGMIVLASIHQPNWETFSLFDKLILLAGGKTMYSGPTNDLAKYLADGLDHPVPQHSNPTDHALDLVNTDFIPDREEAVRHIDSYAEAWKTYAQRRPTMSTLQSKTATSTDQKEGSVHERIRGTASRRKLIGSTMLASWHQTVILSERNMINYSRNLLAYGVRLGMYVGMGVMLATIWVNLAQTSDRVNDRLSVHFYSVAFLGFMSVAGIPAFLEERQVFIRERMDGLYGPGAYVIANSICTIPYLFACSALFCVLIYWSIGLHPGATAFFRFLLVLFVAIYTAESQCTLVAAVIPIFVASLAVASFMNGFWMSVGGYFIKTVSLPRFWYYWAHFIDFQAYAFDLLVYNDLKGLKFTCDTQPNGSCECSYPSSLISQGQCAMLGDDVLKALDINGISFGLYIAILLIITIVYRVLLYVVLVFKKR